jgi:hypothetical protein
MRGRLIVPALTIFLITTSSPVAQADSGVTVVAVGDIAQSGGGQNQSAALTKNLKPQRVILIGDLAYQKGTDKEFTKYFLPKWKPLLSKSLAVPGNHEYKSANAAGYRNLVSKFGMPTTGNDLWWVKSIEGWTVIGLDSEALTGASGAAQLTFLNQALAANDNRPTIVTWHRPAFSRGYHGDQVDTNEIWDIVSADKDVKLALWAHEHNYEQVERLVQVGTANERKINTFTVGTGGAALRNCKTPNIAGELICGKKNNYGVLKLNLKTNSYSWSYLNANGKKLGKQLDKGSVGW